jgi:bifunctional DNase/RNase
MTEERLYPVTVERINRKSDEDSPALVLRDNRGRTFEISIGLCEALAISLTQEGTQVERPLTHDLLLSLAEHLGTPIQELVIDDLSKGTFYARLVLRGPDGPLSLDCRPSDGIAVALRAHVPILATDSVIRGIEHVE